jgi:hypothetical protein
MSPWCNVCVTDAFKVYCFARSICCTLPLFADESWPTERSHCAMVNFAARMDENTYLPDFLCRRRGNRMISICRVVVGDPIIA